EGGPASRIDRFGLQGVVAARDVVPSDGIRGARVGANLDGSGAAGGVKVNIGDAGAGSGGRGGHDRYGGWGGETLVVRWRGEVNRRRGARRIGPRNQVQHKRVFHPVAAIAIIVLERQQSAVVARW